MLKQISILSTLMLLSLNGWALNISSAVKDSWGIRNSGADQIYDLNPIQTYRLQARKGQDIQLAEPLSSPLAARRIKVAVVDTGVDVSHPYLKNRIWRNEAECKAQDNTIDHDGNLYPGDCYGWSILGEATKQNIIGTPEFSDEIGHGTHVAGIIAAIAPNADIVPIQVISRGDQFNFTPIKPFSLGFDLSPSENIRGGFDSSNPTLADRITRAIIYAITQKVDVINLSLGWPQGADAEIMRAAIVEAQSKGIIIVAAAGNDSTSALLRPCQYKGVICVAAHNPDGSIANYSNFGFGVDIAAPGTSIVSVVPHDFGSVRFPGEKGLDILTGTSQASPFVSGVIAEMLARNIPTQEIFARLILGARAVQPELPVIMGPIHSKGVEVKSPASYEKTLTSGLLDMRRSLSLQAQPLILNADKEIAEIIWNKKSPKLAAKFQLKNFWSPIAGQKISIQVESVQKSKIYPAVQNVQLSGATDSWTTDEEKTLSFDLAIQDSADPAQSKLPSDLEFLVSVSLEGKLHRQFRLNAEVILSFDPNAQDPDLQSITLLSLRDRKLKMFLVDEIYDGDIKNRDYFSLAQDEKGFLISLLKQSAAGYQVSAPKLIPFKGQINRTRPHSRIRMDIDFDGQSEYILGLQEFKEDDRQYGTGDYIMHFFIFDEKMQLKRHESFYDLRALIPLDYSWIRVGNELRPAWVGPGKSVIKLKEHDITDLWGVDEEAPVGPQDEDIRFYYLDKNFKLAQVQNPEGARIVDLLHTSTEQVQSGVIPVLVARNVGSEIKPSYINDFSFGWIKNEKLTQETRIKNMSAAQNYRNLIDTRKDKALQLVNDNNEFRGTFWFGFDAHQKQRVTMLDFKTGQLTDKLISSQRSIFDAPLRIRSAYMGKNRKAIFLITNTEIEYHDLTSGSMARASLNKYTYFGDDLLADLQFPITISDESAKTQGSAVNADTKVPALFTTEGSGLNRGVKMLVPIFAKDGRVQQMVSPARLRLKAPQGCRALDYPVYLGSEYAIDYDCGTKILRMKLRY